MDRWQAAAREGGTGRGRDTILSIDEGGTSVKRFSGCGAVRTGYSDWADCNG